MAFTETLEALGSWDLELAEETPADLLAQLGYFGHLVVVDGPVDVEATGNGLLAAARYVGVCRAKAKPGTYTRSGSGLLYWLGDEDGKGHVIETEISLTNATLTQVVAALLPPTVVVGTVYAQADPAARYTGKHVFQPRRDALAIALAPFGAELRVNGGFTVDVGTPAQLYDTALPLTSKPSPMIVRKGAGSDVDLVAVGGKVETEGAVWDYTTRAVLLGQTVGVGDDPDTVFATGSAAASSVPYKDPQGNPLTSTRLISESGETTGSVAARAQLQLNRFNRETTAIKVTADDFEISGGFGVGDATYVYDPDSGILDTANQVTFRGEVIHPAVVRVSSLTAPIVEGMTVAWRTDAGVWLDLTRWVVWESAGSREITVGDLPKSLTRPSDPVQDRVDAARGNPSTKVPKAPAGLTLSTSSAINPKGTDSAVITATWSAVTQYTDNTTVALHHYEVQYRPTFRAPQWQGNTATTDTTVDLPAVAALGYDLQVRAVSTGGVPSAWTSTASITSAADSSGPPAPADPTVTNVLGQLRFRYPGTTNVGGAMPADANRVDFEVAASSSGPWTVENQVNPFVEGIHYVSGTYGAPRYVRLRAFDHNGNPSPYSGTVSGTPLQAGDGDIAALSVGKLVSGTGTFDLVLAGRITTALTGARVEQNSLGFQKFDASNNLLVSITGTEALLTGIYKTALAGRRIEIGAAGSSGEMAFYAPDGKKMRVLAFTSSITSVGEECITMGLVPPAGIWHGWGGLQVEGAGEIFGLGSLADFIVGGDGPETAKGFRVTYASDRGTATVTPTRVNRFAIDATSTTIREASGGARVWVSPTSTYIYGTGSGGARFQVSDTVTRFFPQADPASYGQIEFRPGVIGGAYNSPFMYFQTPQLSGGGFWAGGLLYNINSDGTQGGIAVVNNDNSAYIPIKAQAFNVISDMRDKEEVPEVGPVLSQVRSTPVRSYRRKVANHRQKGDGVDESWVPPEQPLEIGLFAQEAPAQIVRSMGLGERADLLGIDLYQYVAWLHKGMQELASELDDLKETA